MHGAVELVVFSLLVCFVHGAVELVVFSLLVCFRYVLGRGPVKSSSVTSNPVPDWVHQYELVTRSIACIP